METKYTAGPWRVGMKPGPMIYGPRGEQVADLSARMVPDDETAGNVRLIVTAPELLEVARQIILAAEQREGDIPSDIVSGAYAAIYKVTEG